MTLSHILFFAVLTAAPQGHQGARQFAETGSGTTLFHIDYGKQLNENLGTHVLPEENFVVDMVKILGPQPFLSDDAFKAKALMKELSVEASTLGHDFLVPWKRFCRKLHLEEEEFERLYYHQTIRCTYEPWTEKEYPHIKKWLQLNEDRYDAVVRSLKCEKLYFPPVPSKLSHPTAEAVTLSYWVPDIELLLESRVMNAIGNGRFDEAIQGARESYRLGKIYSKAKSWQNHLNAKRQYLYFLYVSRRIAQCNIQKSQIRQIRDFIESNPFELEYHGPVIQTASIELKDLIKHCAHKDHRFFLKKFEVEISDQLKSKIESLLEEVSWPAVCRECIKQFEELDRILKIRPYARQTRELKRFQRRLDRLIGDPWSDAEINRATRGNSKSKSSWVVKAILRDHFPIIDFGTGSLQSFSTWSSWSMVIERDLTLLSLSLEEYRKDHNKYPESLAPLVPRYLKALPQDPLASSILGLRPKEFRYQLVGEDYRLYSVGGDGQDDGGETSTDIVIGASSDPTYHD